MRTSVLNRLVWLETWAQKTGHWQTTMGFPVSYLLANHNPARMGANCQESFSSVQGVATSAANTQQPGDS